MHQTPFQRMMQKRCPYKQGGCTGLKGSDHSIPTGPVGQTASHYFGRPAIVFLKTCKAWSEISHLYVVVYEMPDHVGNMLVDQDDCYVVPICKVFECVLYLLDRSLCSTGLVSLSTMSSIREPSRH